ncbi:MAG: nucleotidyltransferase [Clostridia bacterium]|nr:nucleotidyltransferase [Clostridia bacterium]
MDATLIVMAAGMGSRFGGLKQMEPIGPGGEAILDFSVLDAKKAGFNKVVFVIKEAIAEDFINLVGKRIEKKIAVEYVYQETNKLPEGYTCPAERTKPWGTGHAILMCKDVVNTPFAVINADDFYGPGGFEKIFNGLKNGNWCMAGYLLKNTVTENGYVSRGVCSARDGKLVSIEETPKIWGDCRSENADGSFNQLSPDTVVSMNLWGFTPDAFDYLDREFKKFLDEKINTPGAEFYLPFMVDTVIASGEKSVDVYVAEDKWYGVTYKEDKQTVVDAVKALVDKGLYPEL